jgi:hypothetical protein
MTEREFEQRLRASYRDRVEAVGPMSSDLLASVRSIPDREPMRPAAVSGGRRLLILAATAMLLVLLVSGAVAVGWQLLRMDRDEIELRPDPEQPINWHLQQDTVLPPGTYYVDLATGGGRSGSPTLRVTFTLPAGWERVPIEGLLWGQSKWVVVLVPTNLYVDSCAAEPVLRDPPVGPTAADLAAALSEVRGWTIHEVRDVVMGGHAGKRVLMTAPGPEAPCGDSRLLRTIGWPGFASAWRDREPVTLWILDVEDERLVIWTGSEPAASSLQLRELRQVVESIEITYLAAVPPGTNRGDDP